MYHKLLNDGPESDGRVLVIIYYLEECLFVLRRDNDTRDNRCGLALAEFKASLRETESAFGCGKT